MSQNENEGIRDLLEGQVSSLLVVRETMVVSLIDHNYAAGLLGEEHRPNLTIEEQQNEIEERTRTSFANLPNQASSSRLTQMDPSAQSLTVCQDDFTHLHVTTPVLENDIDDEDFHKAFESNSQWQKEFDSAQFEEKFAVARHPVVPLNIMDQLFEEMVEFEKDVEIIETNAIRTPLLCHQRMALNWMTKRENSEDMAPFWSRTPTGYFNQATLENRSEKPLCMKGGILADDMGLGKTLVTIALILGNHIAGKPMFTKSRKRQNPFDQTSAIECTEQDPIMQARRSLNGRQDKSDDGHEEVRIIKFKKKKEGYLKPKKETTKDLKQPGYKFRQFFMKEMKKKENCTPKPRKKSRKENILEDLTKPKCEIEQVVFSDTDDEKDNKGLSKDIAKLVHSPSLKDFNRKGSSLTGKKKDEPRGTLIICPMSVISNWTRQFQEHVDPEVDLQLYLYYGVDRVKDVEYIKHQDIVLTTYNTLSSDFRQKTSPLHQITWLRIVLDEGHVIRNARSSQSVAAVMLNARRRWVITGTPIQNRMADLWTILKFLRFEPFTDQRWWRDILLLPMRNRTTYTYNRINKLMKHITIRRLKTDLIDGRPIVELPAKTVVVEEITLEGEQKRLYDIMQNKGQLTLCRYLRRGIKYVLKNYANILVMIMRLRQLCCHPKLCQKVLQEVEHAANIKDQLEQWQLEEKANLDQDGTLNEGDAENGANVDEEKLIQQLLQVLAAGDSEECAVCLDNLNNAVITRCAHVFCYDCIIDVIESAQLESLCPLCRGEISKEQLIKVPEKRPEEEVPLSAEEEQLWESSAKIDALMNSLKSIRSDDPSVKSIIVSQFTSFLNLIEIPLRRCRFRYTRIDGGMTQVNRAEAIEEFNDPSENSPTIMLLSLNAGGVGLTLTAATRLYLMDPAWNPAAEEQCFNRCHRLGQNKDVTITKYVVRDSIEERMMELQERKRELMAEAFGSREETNEQRMRGRVQELRNLMGLGD